MPLTTLALVICIILFSNAAEASIKSQDIDYKQDKIELQGFLAFDDLNQEKRPGILIIHQWMGLTEFEKNAAKELAEKGFVALAIDIYGKDSRPKNRKSAGKKAKIYKDDRKLLRARAQAGFDLLKSNKLVNTDQIVCIGFCFGGMAALELARSGVEIAAAVSFHGHLNTPELKDAKNIKGKILVLNGAADSLVSEKEIQTFYKEMSDAEVDWQFINYGGAVHAFTHPDANSKRAKYHKKTAQRAWSAFYLLMEEIKEADDMKKEKEKK